MTNPDIGFGVIWAGGGSRCYAPLVYFDLFCNLWGVRPQDSYKYIDAFGATSGGSFSACAFAKGDISMETIQDLYLTKAQKIFTIRTILDVGQCNTNSVSNRPNLTQKTAMILTNSSFYQSACTDSNYGSALLYSTLNTMFGDTKLNELKTSVLIPAQQKFPLRKQVLFSNFNGYPYNDYPVIDNTSKIVDVCAASSAAPIYLPPYTTSANQIYEDGGLFANAPITETIQLIKRIKPNAKKICILYLGTGQGLYTMEGTAGTQDESVASNLASIIGKCMDGNTAMEELNLKLQMQYNIRITDQVYGLMFTPQFPANLEIDNSTADYFTMQNTLATTYFNNNITDVVNFLAHIRDI